MFKPSDLDTLHRMQATADRVRWMIHARAIAAYCRAFGKEPSRDSRLDMCVIHNSIIDFERGRPWREINYSQMRLARRLSDKSLEPGRLVNDWYRRKCKESRS